MWLLWSTLFPSLPITHSDGDGLELKHCVSSQPLSVFISVKMTEEQWKKGLLQGLNNASAETNLKYLRILQQRPLMRQLFVYMFFLMYKNTSTHFQLKFTKCKLACMCSAVLFTSTHLHLANASTPRVICFPLGSPSAGVVGLLILLKGTMSFGSQHRLCTHILIFGTIIWVSQLRASSWIWSATIWARVGR